MLLKVFKIFEQTQVISTGFVDKNFHEFLFHNSFGVDQFFVNGFGSWCQFVEIVKPVADLLFIFSQAIL